MKRILKDYFTFSKKERMAVIILLLLISSCLLLPYFYGVKSAPPLLNKALISFLAQANSAAQKRDSSPNRRATYNVPDGNSTILQPTLFVFDPNTVTADGWYRLGLAKSTIRTLLNYRNKGGKFRQPEDIRKIWGISKTAADRLIPYVQITENFAKSFQVAIHTPKAPTKLPKILDINTASMQEWESLPGIGNYLAARIIHYREKIGGFMNIGQFKKTYGITDSLFAVISPFLAVQEQTLPKIDLNTASAYTLQQRTGIPEAVARSIVLYRKQYGLFTSIEAIKKIVFVSDSIYMQVARSVIVN